MPKEKSAYWIEVITASREYPSGISAYCRDRNISKKSYYSWFAKLKNQHPEWCQKDTGPGDREVLPLNKQSRRNFTAAQKADILREVDAAPHGEKGAIMRREGIYSPQLRKWREERAVRALEPSKRGPKISLQEKENKRLQEEVASLKKRLAQAEDIIEIQKKISQLLGISGQENS